MLTVAGVDYVRVRLSALEGLLVGTKKVVSQHREVDRYFTSLEKSSAYRKFLVSKGCEGIEPHEFTELLRCSLDTSPGVLRDRLEKLKTRAHQANREEFLGFLAACEQHFVAMLSEN